MLIIQFNIYASDIKTLIKKVERVNADDVVIWSSIQEKKNACIDIATTCDTKHLHKNNLILHCLRFSQKLPAVSNYSSKLLTAEKTNLTFNTFLSKIKITSQFL